jgi:hypothetical protein
MHTFQVGKDGVKPSKYDEETKARAARLVRDHVGDPSEWAAFTARNSGPVRKTGHVRHALACGQLCCTGSPQ